MPLRHRVARKAFAMTSVTVILTALFVGALPMSPYVETADAKYLTAGNGYFKNQINWAEWPAGMSTSTSRRQITSTTVSKYQGDSIVTTCVASQSTSQLPARGSNRDQSNISTVAPGAWSALARAYWETGSGGTNTAAYALQTPTGTNGQAVTSSFGITCSSKIVFESGGEMPVALKGLVVADAESSLTLGSTVTERIMVSPPSNNAWEGYTWHLLERIRSASCANNIVLNRTNQNALTLQNSSVSNANQECGAIGSGINQGYGPAGVAFLKAPGTGVNTISGTVSMVGYGTSAVALGVILDVDYGDAPLDPTTESKIPFSYGTAGALFQPTWSGGIIPSGTSNAYPTTAGVPNYPIAQGVGLTSENAPHAPLATLSVNTATPILGPTISGDGDYQASHDASGDITGDDAFPNGPPVIPIIPAGGSYSTAVTCKGTGANIAGWIDWNQNGKFDNPTERATAVCGQGTTSTVTLTWTNINANYTLDGENYFVRLRIADSVSDFQPTGLTTSGEVEDWILPRLRPAMSLEKTAVANSSKVGTGTEVSYTITLKNIGTAPFSAALPASVKDALGEVLNQGELIPGTNGQLATASKGTATLVGNTPQTKTLEWTSGNSTINVNESVTINYKVRVKDQPAGSSPIITNHAWVANHIDSSVTWEKNKVGQDVPALCETTTGRLLGESKQPICDTAQISRSNLLISKEIRKNVDGTAIPDGTILENGTYYYWIKFENRGGVTETINHTDNYADVADDAPIYREFGDQGLHKIIGVNANEYRSWVDAQPRTTTVTQSGNTFLFTGTLKPQEALYFVYRVDAWQLSGNSIMRNVLHPTGTDCSTAPNACIDTEHPRQPPSTINVTKQLQDSAGTVIAQPAVSELEGWVARLGGDAAKAIEPTATYIDRTTKQDGSIDAYKISQNNKDGRKFTLAELVETISSRGYEHVGITCSGTKADGTTIQAFAVAPTTVGTILPGETLNCVLTNKQLAGSFSWNKVDEADTATKLSGSVWEVTIPNGTTQVTVEDCVRTATDQTPCGQTTVMHDTDKQAGQFTLSGLTWGTYTIREVAAPVGYVLPETLTTYTVTVNGSNLNSRIADIPNRKHTGLVVPLTGGLGSDAFKIFGPALLALAAIVAFIRWRRGHRANL